MPIRFDCPKCDTPVSAPAGAAGRTVRCPTCGQLTKLVPDDAAGDEDPPARPARRKPARVRDSDDRPRGKKKKAAKVPVLWIALGAAAAVLLLVGGGVAVWAVFFRTDPSVGPDGWARLDPPHPAFTAAFPGGRPKYESMWKKPPSLHLPNGKNLRDVLPKIEYWSRIDQGRKYAVVLITIPEAGLSVKDLEPYMNDAAYANATVVEDGRIEVNGCKGRRQVLRGERGTMVAHTYTVGTEYVLKATVGGEGGLDPADPTVAEFFARTTPNPPDQPARP